MTVVVETLFLFTSFIITVLIYTQRNQEQKKKILILSHKLFVFVLFRHVLFCFLFIVLFFLSLFLEGVGARNVVVQMCSFYTLTVIR